MTKQEIKKLKEEFRRDVLEQELWKFFQKACLIGVEMGDLKRMKHELGDGYGVPIMDEVAFILSGKIWSFFKSKIEEREKETKRETVTAICDIVRKHNQGYLADVIWTVYFGKFTSKPTKNED